MDVATTHVNSWIEFLWATKSHSPFTGSYLLKTLKLNLRPEVTYVPSKHLRKFRQCLCKDGPLCLQNMSHETSFCCRTQILIFFRDT